MNLKPNYELNPCKEVSTWDLLDHSERRIYIIPIGGISREEAEKQIRVLMAEYDPDWEVKERKRIIIEKREERLIFS